MAYLRSRSLLGVLLCSTLLSLAGTPLAHGDDAATDTAPVAPAARRVVLEEIPENLLMLVKTFAVHLDVDLIWDVHDPEITARRGVSSPHLVVEDASSLDDLRAFLAPFGLFVQRCGGIKRPRYAVIGRRHAAKTIGLRPEFVDLADADTKALGARHGVYVTGVIPVKHVKNVTAMLREQKHNVFERMGTATLLPGAQAVALTGLAPNVALMLRLLREVDRVGTDAETSLALTPRKTRIAAMLPALRAVYPGLVVAAPAASGGVSPSGVSPSGVSPSGTPPGLRVVVDPRTNTVFLRGPRKAVDVAAETVYRLDTDAAAPELRVRVIPVRFADVGLTTTTVLAAMKAQPSFWRDPVTEQVPTLTPAPSSKAIIVAGYGKVVERVASLVTQLETRAREAAERR